MDLLLSQHLHNLSRPSRAAHSRRLPAQMVTSPHPAGAEIVTRSAHVVLFIGRYNPLKTLAPLQLGRPDVAKVAGRPTGNLSHCQQRSTGGLFRA